MVDFQSRDTRRGPDDDEDETEEATDTETENRDQESETPSGPDVDRTADGETAGNSDGPGGMGYAVVTVAAGRTLEEDDAGGAVVDALEGAGEAVATRDLLAPSYDGIQTSIGALVGRDDVGVVVTVGGTGVEPTDVTVDAVGDLLDKHLPGFGELYRALARDRDGTAVVRTRATAGVVDDVPVFCLPGDPDGARLGTEDIVLPEAAELASQARDPENER